MILAAAGSGRRTGSAQPFCSISRRISARWRASWAEEAGEFFFTTEAYATGGTFADPAGAFQPISGVVQNAGRRQGETRMYLNSRYVSVARAIDGKSTRHASARPGKLGSDVTLP